MSKEVSIINQSVYLTEEAVGKYSHYFLYRPEKYLFNKTYKKNDTILDLACGAGRTTLILYEMGLKVKGVDFSNILIDTAKRRFPYLNLEIGNYNQIKENDATYDHILISYNGLDYAYPEIERIKAIKEFYRVLKKGGSLIYSSHNISSLSFSPYYFFKQNIKGVFWMMKNIFYSIRRKKYIFDTDLVTFYASSDYIIKQTEKEGFKFIEMVGFNASRNHFINKYISPYNYYLFQKI